MVENPYSQTKAETYHGGIDEWGNFSVTLDLDWLRWWRCLGQVKECKLQRVTYMWSSGERQGSRIRIRTAEVFLRGVRNKSCIVAKTLCAAFHLITSLSALSLQGLQYLQQFLSEFIWLSPTDMLFQVCSFFHPVLQLCETRKFHRKLKFISGVMNLV